MAASSKKPTGPGAEIPDDKQAPEPLERRPEARAFKIEDLLDEVRRGRVRIPSFQRDLNWEREDARKLMDSLYRGYPVGTLLFWETDAKPDEIRFGLFSAKGTGRSDALWVVDGQQRIASLSRVLLVSEPDKDDFALYFDLDKSEFIQPPSAVKRNETPARWLPMTVVLDSDELMRWAYEHAHNDKERRDRAFQLGKRIREYEIPAYLVRADKDDTLREIFSRMNSSGKPLQAFEVFDALNGARTQSRPATIREVALELENKFKFGRVEEKIIYRLLRVLQGADVSEWRGKGPVRLDGKQTEEAYRDTSQAVGQVIAFLKREVGIPHYELLPYKNPLVTLGKFFHYHPNPSSRSCQLLARWLWRGALNESHQGDNVSTRKALDQIARDSEEVSVQKMLRMVKQRPENSPDVTAPFNFRFAASKLQALALMELGPRDLETGELLDLGGFLGDRTHDYDLPFSHVVTYKTGSRKDLVQSAANRLAHPNRPGGLRRLLRQVAGELMLELADLDVCQYPPGVTVSTVLASHGITEAAAQALRDGDAVQFLELRAEYLRPHFQRFFDRHARWDEPDRPSLASLVVSDDEDD